VSLYTVCAEVGGLVIVRLVVSLLWTVYRTVFRSGNNPRKYGEWAIVTGATDGIGKAISFELARKGCSVLLLSRTAAKLEVTMQELKKAYPNVQVRTMAIDFGNFTEAVREQLKELVETLDVGVLVNNVGMTYDFCQYFHELSDAEVSAMLAVNIESTTWMTRTVLPGMRSRKRGAVLNMSSAASRPPTPLLAEYSAAKGYIENFTRALDVEYASQGIRFQCQSPYWVATAMTFPNSKIPLEKRATFFTPTATRYARCSVAQIGNDVMISPYWVHDLALWIQDCIPEFLKVPVIMKIHKGIRYHKKNVAKMEEKQGCKNKNN